MLSIDLKGHISCNFDDNKTIVIKGILVISHVRGKYEKYNIKCGIDQIEQAAQFEHQTVISS